MIIKYTTYVGDPSSAYATTPEYLKHLGQLCEIVGVVSDETDPHPTNDWFRVRFSDDVEIDVAPEELDPIPPVGMGR